jgi:peptidyl-prolyl cis-trans isomerase SDCCAG10
MSSIYLTEPVTSGKVLLHTTLGDIDIELWSKEAPLACRNFVQLCLEGYYDGCLVHRVIKGFMMQSGDPTGTGSAGESIWGRAFADEFHARLKFNHRGIVAMANEQKPHSNNSQFFISLDACEFLNKKHTIFGKVTGTTMFNLLQINDVEIGEGDRPLEPVKILSADVLANPFDDIVPRNRALPTTKGVSADEAKKSLQRKGTRDLKLLSFAEDGEGERKGGEDGEGEAQEGNLLARKKRRVKGRDDVEEQVEVNRVSNATATAVTCTAEKSVEQPQAEQLPAVVVKSQKDSSEFLEIKAALMQAKKQPQARVEQHQEVKKSALTLMREKYATNKGKGGGDRQSETLSRLGKFSEHLRSIKASSSGGETRGAAEAEAYHGQVLEKDEGEEPAGDSWAVGPLKFKRHVDDEYRSKLDDYVVQDTRK